MQYLLNERSNIPLVYIRLFILFGGFPGGASGNSGFRKMKKEREDLLPGPTSGLTNSVKVHVSEGTQQEL